MSPAIPLIAVLMVVVPAAYAQMQAGEAADQKEVVVYLDGAPDARILHVIGPGEDPRQLKLVPGAISNLSVGDESGMDVQYATAADGSIVVSPSELDVMVEYVIRDALTLKGNVWTWDFRYLENVLFVLPPEPDTVYANDQPVHLGDTDRIRCHGCQMKLEYTTGEPVTLHGISWEEHEFVVAVRSHDTIESMELHQPSMSMIFEVAEGGEFVTVVIPREMLGDPYQVYLADEKVWFHAYRDNGTHAWVNIRPEAPGTVTVVGSTVIPEFPAAVMVLAAAASAPLLHGAVTRRRLRTSRNRTRLCESRRANTLWYS